MGLFSILSSKEVDAFAKSLAQDLAKRYPPTMENSESSKISEKRITAILEQTFEKASEFQANKKLGVYKKARMGNSFRWELTELGYSEKFVDLATEGLVVYMTRA